MYKVYEELFGRVPLSLLRYHWFLENISATKRRAYDFLKRAMDVAISLPLFVFSLLWYPFVATAIKLDDGGAVFIVQERVGAKGRLIRTYKFRSMLRNEENPTTRAANTVTRVGAFLRRTRLDELPQLWSVLRGEMSLIGPRPELSSLVSLYEREVPYYNIRHLIKPGLSGWAQIYHENHPHHQADISETKVKLSYDLYYIKHRSLWLDLKIALKTVKILLSRSGV
jgi:lipopolysaccharide/colanic/teichoic acid biosynthesis glycosyltransferase